MANFTPVATPADIAAVEDILKEVFVPDRLESQLYTDMVVLDFVEDVTDFTDSNGLKAVVPLHTGRTGAVSARAVGEKLAPADHQRVARAEYEYTNHYVQARVEGPVVARMSTNRQSVVREIDLEINGAIEDLKRDWVRQIYGRGDAVVARSLPGGASSATVLIGAANYWAIERGFIHVGMHVDIGTTSDPTASTGGNRVTGIIDSPSAPGFTVLNPTATTAGHHVFRAGNAGVSGSVAQRELNGLEKLGSATLSLGGLDPTVTGNEFWKGVVSENGGTKRDLSTDLLLNQIRKLRQQGRYPDFAIGDLYQEQRYYNLLQSDVRYIGDKEMSFGNTQGLQLGKIKSGFVGDPDCVPGKVFMGVKGALTMYSAGPIAWQNQTTGGNILAWLQDYDAFVCRAAKYKQLGTNRRKSLGWVGDLND